MEAVDSGLFDDTKKLLVCESVSSFKDKHLQMLLEVTDKSVLFICGKVVLKSLMGVSDKEAFEEPKAYKKEEWCADLLGKMAKGRGLTISPAICKSIVQRVGQDIGVLKFEVLKLSLVASGSEITAQEVVGVISPLSEMSGTALIDAVFSKNPTTFLKACLRFESNRKTDPTISLTNGLLQHSLISALEVRLCLDKGLSAGDIASRLGSHPFVVENTLIPQARVFSTKKLREFIGVLYVCERLAKTSSVDPFSTLKVGFLRVMIS
jgi:DNA polymerase III delta subunit